MLDVVKTKHTNINTGGLTEEESEKVHDAIMGEIDERADRLKDATKRVEETENQDTDSVSDALSGEVTKNGNQDAAMRLGSLLDDMEAKRTNLENEISQAEKDHVEALTDASKNYSSTVKSINDDFTQIRTRAQSELYEVDRRINASKLAQVALLGAAAPEEKKSTKGRK